MSEQPPKDLEFRVRHVDGEVVFDFSHNIKHFRLPPDIAMKFTEATIAASVAAAEFLHRRSAIVVVGGGKPKPGLIIPPGLKTKG